VALASRLIPGSLHGRALAMVKPDRRCADTFPAHYRASTARALAALFPPERFAVRIVNFGGEPSYHRGSRLLAGLFRAYETLLPRRLLMVFARKRLDGAPSDETRSEELHASNRR
jgi:hypothetical protein